MLVQEDFTNRMPDDVLEAAWATNEVHDIFIAERAKLDEYGPLSQEDSPQHIRGRNDQGLILLAVRGEYQRRINDLAYVMNSYGLLPKPEDIQA